MQSLDQPVGKVNNNLLKIINFHFQFLNIEVCAFLILFFLEVLDVLNQRIQFRVDIWQEDNFHKAEDLESVLALGHLLCKIESMNAQIYFPS